MGPQRGVGSRPGGRVEGEGPAFRPGVRVEDGQRRGTVRRTAQGGPTVEERVHQELPLRAELGQRDVRPDILPSHPRPDRERPRLVQGGGRPHDLQRRRLAGFPRGPDPLAVEEHRLVAVRVVGLVPRAGPAAGSSIVEEPGRLDGRLIAAGAGIPAVERMKILVGELEGAEAEAALNPGSSDAVPRHGGIVGSHVVRAIAVHERPIPHLEGGPSEVRVEALIPVGAGRQPLAFVHEHDAAGSRMAQVLADRQVVAPGLHVEESAHVGCVPEQGSDVPLVRRHGMPPGVGVEFVGPRAAGVGPVGFHDAAGAPNLGEIRRQGGVGLRRVLSGAREARQVGERIDRAAAGLVDADGQEEDAGLRIPAQDLLAHGAVRRVEHVLVGAQPLGRLEAVEHVAVGGIQDRDAGEIRRHRGVHGRSEGEPSVPQDQIAGVHGPRVPPDAGFIDGNQDVEAAGPGDPQA